MNKEKISKLVSKVLPFSGLALGCIMALLLCATTNYYDLTIFEKILIAAISWVILFLGAIESLLLCGEER